MLYQRVVKRGLDILLSALGLILLFLWVSSPIASHLVSRMELSTDETASSHMRKEDRDVCP